MAKARWRRLVLLVIRTLPLDTLRPLALSAEGKRGTRSRITAARMASPAPTQSKLESTFKSIARTGEARGVASEDRDKRLRDDHRRLPRQRRTRIRLSANSMRRNAPELGAEGCHESKVHLRGGTVRARIRLATLQQAIDE